MNERFFDLKKDRQDRIINGALKVITENGYRHASTDEMVAAASISKGLLFHYFKSKKGVYQFLYEYGTRYTLIEMREAERRTTCDYYEMQRLLMKADAAVLRQYPYLPLFLYRADTEAPETGVDLPPDLTGAVQKRRGELLARSQRPPLLKEEDIAVITGILSYVRIGLMQDLVTGRNSADEPQGGESEESEAVPAPLHIEYTRRYSDCLQMMRRLNM